jgi:molybdopterin-guanine dinucleotide biosynthesis protein A
MGSNAGVILAGGKSIRMGAGADKATMPFAGEPLLARVVGRIAPVVDKVLVIGPPALAQLLPQARVLADDVASVGPLAGLYTALMATTCARVFLQACDMPFVDPELVRAMLEYSERNPAAQAITLRSQNRRQPLHAVYTRDCLPAVIAALATDDHAMGSLLDRLAVLEFDAGLDGERLSLSTFNINTPAEWRQAEQLEREQGARRDSNGGR